MIDIIVSYALGELFILYKLFITEIEVTRKNPGEEVQKPFVANTCLHHTIPNIL